MSLLLRSGMVLQESYFPDQVLEWGNKWIRLNFLLDKENLVNMNSDVISKTCRIKSIKTVSLDMFKAPLTTLLNDFLLLFSKDT